MGKKSSRDGNVWQLGHGDTTADNVLGTAIHVDNTYTVDFGRHGDNGVRGTEGLRPVERSRRKILICAKESLSQHGINWTRSQPTIHSVSLVLDHNCRQNSS